MQEAYFCVSENMYMYVHTQSVDVGVCEKYMAFEHEIQLPHKLRHPKGVSINLLNGQSIHVNA